MFKTKINVIMPVFLGNYQNSASNKEYKFSRAVESFLNQTYQNKELIIISDGCKISEQIYFDKFSNIDTIKFIKIEKQPLFSGNVRNTGLKTLTGQCGIVTYLDADDTIKPHHLFTIVENFNDNIDWLYYDDVINTVPNEIMRHVELKPAKIGTSNLAHEINDKFNWVGCNGYGHDWTFINTKLMKSNKYKKIKNTGYVVHHIPRFIDN